MAVSFENEFDLLFSGLIPSPVADNPDQQTTLDSTIYTYRKKIIDFQDVAQYLTNHDQRVLALGANPTRALMYSVSGSTSKYTRKSQEKKALKTEIAGLETRIQTLLAETSVFSRFSEHPF